MGMGSWSPAASDVITTQGTMSRAKGGEVTSEGVCGNNQVELGA